MINKNVLDIGKNSLITIGLLALATIIGYSFSLWNIQETNIVVTYLLSVLLIARFTKGYFYGIAATVLSLILFNWFFTAPYFTLKVNDPTYSITFIIMSITAITTSALTTKVKEQAISSQEKEAESNALYRMTNLLTAAEDYDAIANITARTVSKILSCETIFVLYDENGKLEKTYIKQDGDKQTRLPLDYTATIEQIVQHLNTSHYIDKKYYNYPIFGKTMILAILSIPKETASILTDDQKRMLFAIIESTALALERLSSLRAQAKIHEEATQEHYRGNLLRAISHDIRTPLSGIMGSVEMLMGMTDKDDPRYQIEAGVYQDADWLHSLVENILNLTKLHDGHLNIAKQQEAVEEVIAAAIMVIEKRFPDRNIDISIPDDLVMVPMDAKLISQVIINLLDNAVKHSPQDKEISISAQVVDNNVEFSVADRGSGINENDLPNVFQMFYTTRRKSPDAERGIGLGLAICQSIVEAHGGKIEAHNRKEGGAEFTFTLPLEVK